MAALFLLIYTQILCLSFVSFPEQTCTPLDVSPPALYRFLHRDSCQTPSVSLSITSSNQKELKADPRCSPTSTLTSSATPTEHLSAVFQHLKSYLCNKRMEPHGWAAKHIKKEDFDSTCQRLCIPFNLIYLEKLHFLWWHQKWLIDCKTEVCAENYEFDPEVRVFMDLFHIITLQHFCHFKVKKGVCICRKRYCKDKTPQRGSAAPGSDSGRLMVAITGDEIMHRYISKDQKILTTQFC